MPGSATTPDPRSPCAGALRDVAFHVLERVGIRDKNPIVAQWLACTCPCRRFDDSLAAALARLGVDVDRYSFIAVDLHHLLFAGLPALPAAVLIQSLLLLAKLGLVKVVDPT
jgi:hypothetical protein